MYLFDLIDELNGEDELGSGQIISALDQHMGCFMLSSSPLLAFHNKQSGGHSVAIPKPR
jgi:hypothetical protein